MLSDKQEHEAKEFREYMDNQITELHKEKYLLNLSSYEINLIEYSLTDRISILREDLKTAKDDFRKYRLEKEIDRLRDIYTKLFNLNMPV